MSDANEILDLIDKASTKQFDRDIRQLERLADVGDRLVAQHVVMANRTNQQVEADPMQPVETQ